MVSLSVIRSIGTIFRHVFDFPIIIHNVYHFSQNSVLSPNFTSLKPFSNIFNGTHIFQNLNPKLLPFTKILKVSKKILFPNNTVSNTKFPYTPIYETLFDLLLQSVAKVITKCGSFQLLQSVSHQKVWQVLQIVAGSTKCGRVYYKMWQAG